MSQTPAPESENEKPRVFVSYGRADAREIADRLCVDLAANGYAVWQDAKNIRAGDVWHQKIEEGLRSCQLVVALLSPHSLRRGRAGEDYSVCLDEWSFAQSELRRPIVPALVQRGPEPPPLFLHRLDYVDLTRWIDSEEQYQAGLARLLQALDEARQGVVRYRSWDRTLQPWDFSAFLHEKRRGFTGRQWLFDEIEAWRLASGGERILLIKGDPGAGKSALLAELAHRNPHVAAHHCCQADVQATLDPGRFVRSVAAMLASRFDDYAVQLDANDVQEALSQAATDPIAAFDAGVLAPLERFSPDAPVYLLVDALDEALARREGSLTIVDLLAARRDRLPGWLRVIATTRDQPSVLDRLAGLRARTIDARDPRNLEDVAAYVRMRLAQPNLAERLAQSGVSESAAASALEKRSGGNFLYARQALDAIERDECGFRDLGDLPPGLFGLYRAFFARQFPLRRSEEGEEIASGYDKPRRVLEALIAAEEPLDEAQLAAATELDRDEELPRALRRLTGYVPERPDAEGRMRFSFFHKSLPDWLAGRDLRGGPYAVVPRRGHRRLADSGWREYERAASSDSPYETVARLSDYVLRHLPRHLLAAERWEELERLLTDLAYLEAKVRRGLAFDLVADFARAVAALPDERPQRRILSLLAEAIRRDVHFVARHAQDYPQGLFQCLWNSCWWFDAPDAAPHYIEPEEGWGEPPPWEAPGPRLHRLLERWRAERPPSVWLRARRPPRVHLGSGQLAVFVGHEGPVNSVAWSPDDRRIASGSDDGTVRVWDAESGAELRCLRGHEAAVNSVAFSPDGSRIVSGSSDRTVRIWSVEGGAQLACLRGHDAEVSGVAWSPEGRRIAGGSSAFDATMRIWDAESGEELHCVACPDGGKALVFSQDGRLLAAASLENRLGTVRIWDVSSGSEIASIVRPHERVADVAFTPTGIRFVTGSYRRSLSVWNACRDVSATDTDAWLEATEVPLETFNAYCLYIGRSNAHGISLAAEGCLAVGVLSGNSLGVWDAESGLQLRRFRGHSRMVNDVAFSSDVRRIVSGSMDATLRVWDLKSDSTSRNSRGAAYCMAFSPFEDRIAVGTGDGLLSVWDARTGIELRRQQVFRGNVEQLCYTSDGRLIVGSSMGRTVATFDARSGTEISRHERGDASDACFSPDGSRILWIRFVYPQTLLELWDSRNGISHVRRFGSSIIISGVAFSPSGCRFVCEVRSYSSPETVIHVFDAETGADLCRIAYPFMRSPRVAFATNEQFVIVEEHGRRLVFDSMSGEKVTDSAVTTIFSERREPLALAEKAFHDPGTSSPFAWFAAQLEDAICNPSDGSWIGLEAGEYLQIVEIEEG